MYFRKSIEVIKYLTANCVGLLIVMDTTPSFASSYFHFPIPTYFLKMVVGMEKVWLYPQTRCVQLLCQSNTPKLLLDNMEKCKRANGEVRDSPLPFLVINHAWQHRISQFQRHCYWHYTHCHSSPPRNYKKLEKKSPQATHVTSGPTPPTLAEVHSSPGDERMFATCTISPFYCHCGLLENLTELIALHLLAGMDIM